MAKEMMIVFVYDTECCQDESDDPVEAVLYFHPSWVSDTQKLSLCGQIMGTAHFLRETFGKTRMIALQNGKFVLKEFGRFVLAVGTDRNINQSLLEHRAELLSALVKLFHHDIQTIYDQLSASGQIKNISDKLYHIFETYLPILQYNGNIYQNMPISKLPKSASNIFLEAMHALQSCQKTKGILGGSILYHNKVIATQLYSKLAKNLVLTDPYRIKSTAESIPVKFHIPLGCQLITIFIPKSEFNELFENSDRIQTMCNQSQSNGNVVNGAEAIVPNGAITNNSSSSNSYPFQFKKKIMKRDKSIVFTNIPEEGSTSAINGEKSTKPDELPMKNSANGEDQVKPSATVRPNHLPLRFKNITTKDIPPESGFSSSITFDEQDSFPQFIGRTSVCSTPMTENKVLHITGNIMPICGNIFSEKNGSTPKTKAAKRNMSENIVMAPPSIQREQEEGIELKDLSANGKISPVFELPDNFANAIAHPFSKQTRCNSLIDIGESFRKLSRHMQPLGARFTKFMDECDYVAEGKIYINDEKPRNGISMRHRLSNALTDVDCDADVIDDVVDKKRYRTITDPTYPVFNSLGQPISRYLFDEIQYQNAEQNSLSAKRCNFKMLEFDQPPEVINHVGVSEKQENLKSESPPKVEEKIEKPPLPKNNLNRKSLTLPLKSLNSDSKSTSDDGAKNNYASNDTNIFDKPEQRRKLTGVQLTPLITKLSILAMNDERSSGFSSWDTTPGIELATPLDSAKLFRRRSSVRAEDTEQVSENADSSQKSTDYDENDLKKVELFICGQNSMTMLLLMEEGYSQKQEVVQSMFDICVSKLPRLETNLNKILNVNMNGDKTDGGYSFFCIDHDWDTLNRGGPWSTTDLTSIEYIRHDLQLNTNLHNIVIRGDDSVIYGHQSIGSNIFYKQSAQSLCGLPPPADAMGTISKHARRHLERDHSISLF